MRAVEIGSIALRAYWRIQHKARSQQMTKPYHILISFLRFMVLFIPLSFLSMADAQAEVKHVGGLYLRLSPGARPVGMRGAFVGVSDDINALYWNPAGLTKIDGPTLLLSHSELYQGIRYEYAALATCHSRWALASSFSFLNTGELERRIEPTDSPLSTFTPYALVATVSCALNIARKFSIGTTGKFLMDKIYDSTESAIAFDLGLSWREPIPNTTIACALRNLYPPLMTSLSYPDELPVIVAAGISTKLFKQLTLAADMNYFLYRKPEVKVGAEWWFNEIVALRTGYEYDLEESDLSFNGIAVGASYRHKNFQLDYAYVPNNVLGDNHRVSLKFIAPPLSGIVILIQDDIVLLDLGHSSGVKKGDTFIIYRIPEAKPVARVTVTLVRKQTSTALIESVEPDEQIKVSYLAKRTR
jgi:hypothetical protein